MERLPIVIVGDFNVNVLKEPNNLLIKALASKDFCQVVRSPTHMSGSCIDHIYVLKDTACDTRVIPVPYSQHAAIQIKIKM
jgi:endonuclease/exonuclease/phosphatase (EEP) superfamily protein YafD